MTKDCWAGEWKHMKATVTRAAKHQRNLKKTTQNRCEPSSKMTGSKMTQNCCTPTARIDDPLTPETRGGLPPKGDDMCVAWLVRPLYRYDRN